MRTNKLCLHVVFALTVCFAAQAQNGNAILQNSFRALGCSVVTGNTTIMATGSLKVVQTGVQMPILIHSKGVDTWRSEIDTPKERKVTIVSRGRGQVQHGDGHITQLATHNTSHQRATHIPCLSTLNSLPGQISVNYLRTESVGGDTLDVIEVLPIGTAMPKVFADRAKTTFWISRSTGYVIRTRYINAAEQDFNDVEPVDVNYADYRVVDGLAVPFRQQTMSGERAVLVLTLDSVRLNSPAADFNLR